MQSNNWEQRFDEQCSLCDLQYPSEYEKVKSFISQLLSEVINEIPDDAQFGISGDFKQQLKDKYGIK